ncbi:MAG TPA: MerR family transcriptional regulator, partial [Solirubrobacteraceae bacterium]
MTLAEAAARVGVQPATLRRWVKRGLIPQYDGEWTTSAVGTARVVGRMRERGHSLDSIARATDEGRLALGFLEDLFPFESARVTIREAARETGLEERLVERLVNGLGISPERSGTVTEDELQLLRYVNAVLESGFPLVALLQLVRVYGQAMARIADAEVRLFHLYVHEPLMRSGSTGVETAEQMHAISRQVLPLAGPVLDQVHQRYLQHFVEQDVVG